MYAAKLTALPQFNCSTERVKKLVHRLIIKFLNINHGNLLGHNLRKVKPIRHIANNQSYAMIALVRLNISRTSSSSINIILIKALHCAHISRVNSS